MIGRINKYGRIRGGRDVSRSGRSTSAADLPLDHRLSFKPSPDEHWTFEDDGSLCMNGVDIGEMVDDEREDVRFLCCLTRALHDYQLFVWAKGGKGQADFNAKVFALQDKIHGRLGDIYDNLTGGMKIELSDGEFWLNNINVRKVINLFYQNPSERVRQYLIGLRDKLGLILSKHRTTKRYNGVHKEVDTLFHDISLALEYIPADAPPRLGDGRGYV